MKSSEFRIVSLRLAYVDINVQIDIITNSKIRPALSLHNLHYLYPEDMKVNYH